MPADLMNLFSLALGLGFVLLAHPVLVTWTGLWGLSAVRGPGHAESWRIARWTTAASALAYVPVLALYIGLIRTARDEYLDAGSGQFHAWQALELRLYLVWFLLFLGAAAGAAALVAHRRRVPVRDTAGWTALLVAAFGLLAFWGTESVQQCISGGAWILTQDVCE